MTRIEIDRQKEKANELWKTLIDVDGDKEHHQPISQAFTPCMCSYEPYHLCYAPRVFMLCSTTTNHSNWNMAIWDRRLKRAKSCEIPQRNTLTFLHPLKRMWISVETLSPKKHSREEFRLVLNVLRDFHRVFLCVIVRERGKNKRRKNEERVRVRK